jgi:hypothetical protein
MSDNIDYDELDRAIAESQKQNAKKVTKAPKTRATSTASSTKPAAKSKVTVNRTPAPAAAKPAPAVTQDLSQNFPPRRRVYMDFIGKPRRQNTEVSTVRLKQPEAEAPRRVAHFATATPGMPSYRVANSHQPVRAQSIPTNPVVRKAAPVSSVKPASKQIVVPKVQTRTVAPAAPTVTKAAAKPVAPAPAPKPEPVAKTEPSQTAVAASNIVKTIEHGPTAPNANNYSLGVRSPYLRQNAKVEKRPLNGDVSEFVQDDKIEKNSYPEQTEKPKKKTHSKHTVKKSEKSNSNWYWPILVILIVAAGGGLGYLLWWILQGAS